MKLLCGLVEALNWGYRIRKGSKDRNLENVSVGRTGEWVGDKHLELG